MERFWLFSPLSYKKGTKMPSFYDYPLTREVTGDTDYFTLHTIYFQGTNALGTPTGINAICGWLDDEAIQNVRIVDVTNGNAVVAEKLNITAQFPADVDLGTLSNLSADVAIWEVQALSVNTPGPDGDVAVGSLRLKY